MQVVYVMPRRVCGRGFPLLQKIHCHPSRQFMIAALKDVFCYVSSISKLSDWTFDFSCFSLVFSCFISSRISLASATKNLALAIVKVFSL